MRAQGAVASVLAVLLLALSCVASACTTRCSLSGVGRGAGMMAHAPAHDGGSLGSAPSAAPAMQDCAMAGMERSAGAGSACIGAESVCSHSRCGEQMALLRVGEEPLAQATQLYADAGLSAMTLPPTLRTQAVLLEFFSKRKTPVVPLLLQLRV